MYVLYNYGTQTLVDVNYNVRSIYGKNWTHRKIITHLSLNSRNDSDG